MVGLPKSLPVFPGEHPGVLPRISGKVACGGKSVQFALAICGRISIFFKYECAMNIVESVRFCH